MLTFTIFSRKNPQVFHTKDKSPAIAIASKSNKTALIYRDQLVRVSEKGEIIFQADAATKKLNKILHSSGPRPLLTLPRITAKILPRTTISDEISRRTIRFLTITILFYFIKNVIDGLW
jgi:hypothetical protein